MKTQRSRFTPKWFYIKATSKYLYVGQTRRDVENYRGSGVKWQRHLDKSGEEPTTLLSVWCPTPEDFQFCLDTFVGFDYVSDDRWANACFETPWDGTDLNGFKHTQESKDRISEKTSGENHPLFGTKRPDTSERNRNNNPMNDPRNRRYGSDNSSTRPEVRAKLRKPKKLTYYDCCCGESYSAQGMSRHAKSHGIACSEWRTICQERK